MAGKVRVEIDRQALLSLMRTGSLVEGRTAAVRDACNSDTGRDDFESEVEVTSIRARGRVWAPAGVDGNVLVRNLDAGG